MAEDRGSNHTRGENALVARKDTACPALDLTLARRFPLPEFQQVEASTDGSVMARILYERTLMARSALMSKSNVPTD